MNAKLKALIHRVEHGHPSSRFTWVRLNADILFVGLLAQDNHMPA